MHEWTYEGEIGEQTEAPEVLAARREAAREAARAAGMVGLPLPPAPPRPAEDFPSLSGAAGRQASGWAARLSSSRPRAEDFPALHGPPAAATVRGGKGRAGARGRGGGRGGGGSNFRSAVEAYPTRAQEIAMSGPGDGGWCFDYPMPPAEQPTSGGGGGGGGKAGGGPRRVAGIGNMKLKVDKKAGKRKQKGGGGGDSSSSKNIADQAPAGQAREGDAGSAPLPSSMMPSPAAVAVVEDFPLAPGMTAPATSRAAPSSTGPTLAQSIAAQQAPPPVQSGGGRRGGGPPSVVGELKELLGEEAFSEVKELSASYRSGWMMPGEYFKAMQERIPEECFR